MLQLYLAAAMAVSLPIAPAPFRSPPLLMDGSDDQSGARDRRRQMGLHLKRLSALSALPEAEACVCAQAPATLPAITRAELNCAVRSRRPMFAAMDFTANFCSVVVLFGVDGQWLQR